MTSETLTISEDVLNERTGDIARQDFGWIGNGKCVMAFKFNLDIN